MQLQKTYFSPDIFFCHKTDTLVLFCFGMQSYKGFETENGVAKKYKISSVFTSVINMKLYKMYFPPVWKYSHVPC